MIWIAAALFVAAGIVMIYRRSEIARGQSLMWGGTTYPGCVIIQGALMMVLGAMFVIAWRLGWLG